jgi:hypothetical protein
MADETQGAAPAKPAKAAKAGKKGETIKVRGPEDARWRAGIQFGPIEQEIELSTITVDQLAEIEADPYLSVQRSEASGEKPV